MKYLGRKLMDNNISTGISNHDQNKALFREAFLALESSERKSFMELLEKKDDERHDLFHSIENTILMDMLCLGGTIAMQGLAIEILTEGV